MASNSFGRFFRITTFGESHGPALGVVIDGVPSRVTLDLGAVQAELDRRRPGQSALSTQRREEDAVELLSGTFEGRTTGSPLAFLIANRDARSADYRELAALYRPGHADFTWQAKYGVRDPRGGGRASGRETAARVAAGSVARQILAPLGVDVFAHVTEVGGVRATRLTRADIEANPVRAADAEAALAMRRAIEEAHAAGDSLGGVVQVHARAVPVGWGAPIYHKLDAELACALMSIGAVKGVEIGDGFALARMRGSEANDAPGSEGFTSNHAGGILGGISNGAEIVARVAVKPTPSIAKLQSTLGVDGAPAEISVRGRHDPCIAPRVVPVVEAMVCLVLVDAYLEALMTQGAMHPDAASGAPSPSRAG